jgi:hypothetical protein
MLPPAGGLGPFTGTVFFCFMLHGCRANQILKPKCFIVFLIRFAEILLPTNRYMNKIFLYTTLIIVAVTMTLSSCSNKGTADAPDVSKINIPYKSYAFYKDFAAVDPNHIAAGLGQLKNKYPAFTDFYLDTLIGFGYHHQYNDTNKMMHDFLTLKDYRSLLDTVTKAFPDTKKYDEWLKQSFCYLHYYDSTFDVPYNVYYFVSGLNGKVTALKSATEIGIGLDLFLGRDYLPYKQLSIPDYATIRMTDDNMPVWVMKAIYEDKYPLKSDDKDLLYLMIQSGKEMYFVEKTTPYMSEELRFGFTKAQMDWCKKNEATAYNFLLQNQLLFDKNLQKTLRYVNDGPSSAGMPMESPGNIGSYLGWVIVKHYMDKHPISMHQLLEMTDAQQILTGANYKP